MTKAPLGLLAMAVLVALTLAQAQRGARGKALGMVPMPLLVASTLAQAQRGVLLVMPSFLVAATPA